MDVDLVIKFINEYSFEEKDIEATLREFQKQITEKHNERIKEIVKYELNIISPSITEDITKLIK